MSLKKVFNWLATRSEHAYTLQELAFTIRPDINWGAPLIMTMDRISRAGRATERTITLSAAFAAVSVGVATGGVAGVLAGVGGIFIGKIAGVVAAIVADTYIEKINKRFNP